MSNEKTSPITPTSSEPEAERGGHLSKTVTDGIHEYRETEGYVIDDSDGNEGVKYAADGHTRLIPQPSDDPRDPLNWSWRKKHAILFVVAAAAFLPDYGSATGAVTLQPQAEYVLVIRCNFVKRCNDESLVLTNVDREWGMTPDEVNHSQAGNVFMLGAGGVLGTQLSLLDPLSHIDSMAY